MSCPHGNPIGGCDTCDEVDAAFEAGKRSALAEQPAPVQQGGLEMVDDEGENRAVRMFLALYGGACGVTSEQMRKHLKMAGFDGAWPEWANSHNGHLTKAGAQLWIRHLFSLEQPAQQQEPVLWQILNGVCHAGVRPTENLAKEAAAGMQKIHDLGGSLAAFHVRPLYKSPPASKPWVGLTPDDIRGLCANTIPSTWDISLCRLVEKFLKEKNNA